ncbi:hypothetical protein ACKS23_06414 [Histoplasma ohiense]
MTFQSYPEKRILRDILYTTEAHWHEKKKKKTLDRFYGHSSKIQPARSPQLLTIVYIDVVFSLIFHRSLHLLIFDRLVP